MTSDAIVYESPDGGNTVYSRKVGETVRTLHHADPSWKKANQLYQRWENLKPIVYMADTDPAINELLTKLEMLYALKK